MIGMPEHEAPRQDTSVEPVSALAGLSLAPLRNLGTLLRDRDEAEAEAAVAEMQNLPAEAL
jgi:hypothetical protein